MNLAEESKHHAVELVRPLQRCEALIACDRQGHGAMGFEILKVIVARFHISYIRRSGRLKCDNDFQAFYKTAQKTSEITKSWGTGRSRPPRTGAGVG